MQAAHLENKLLLRVLWDMAGAQVFSQDAETKHQLPYSSVVVGVVVLVLPARK